MIERYRIENTSHYLPPCEQNKRNLELEVFENIISQPASNFHPELSSNSDGWGFERYRKRF